MGVIATESTIRSDAYGRAIQRLDPAIEITSRACPLFVPLVEENWEDDEIARLIAERYLAPLLEVGIDTLVLGCTHYPLLEPVLQRVTGPAVRLIDSAETMAGLVERELDAMDLRAGAGTSAQHHFCVTDSGQHFARVARELLSHVPSPEGAAPLEVALELVEV